MIERFFSWKLIKTIVSLSRSSVNHSAIRRHAFYLLFKTPPKTRALWFKTKRGEDSRSAPESPVICLLFSRSSLYAPYSAFSRLKAGVLIESGP